MISSLLKNEQWSWFMMGLMERLMENVVKQVQKPKRRFGKLIVRGMNRGHAKIAAWGLSNLSVSEDDIILDIGCGGGRDVKAFARMAINGKIYGIDVSEVALEAAKKTNKEFINAGRVEIQQDSVSSLPFEKNTFDLVTGVEVYYFWPDLINDLKEIYRVLKPYGTLALINEGYKSDNEEHRRKSVKWARMGNFNIHTPEEMKNFLKKADYSEIELIEERTKGWLMVKGKKLPK